MRAFAAKGGLALASTLLTLCVVELGYRLLDPFPYIGQREFNHSEHGNLSEYDSTLGWRGVASGQGELVTPHNRVRLAHNRQGFRDIEHDANSQKPAILFLGDSFTWGYEVEFEDMFVNRLRGELPHYDLYNLAHRGHGTDQQLLTFRQWGADQPLRLVVLMFSENDVADNNATMRSMKMKPRFEIRGEDLVLTGTPVPRVEAWQTPHSAIESTDSRDDALKRWLFRSHFLHDVWFRYQAFGKSRGKSAAKRTPSERAARSDLGLTARILLELKEEVEARGAELVLFFIPSRREFNRVGAARAYQRELLKRCEEMDVTAFDLAEPFRRSWLRTYYRGGGHLTRRGHQVAADAIRTHLTQDLGL